MRASARARWCGDEAMSDRIIFDNVSKFYGEVLGVNRISLNIPPGVTTLVGPNGSGKTTLMNLMTGLVQPSSGTVSVLGLTPGDATEFFREVGYCTQFDSFPRGLDRLGIPHGQPDAPRHASRRCLQARAGGPRPRTARRRRRPQDRRLQQGHAPEDPPRPGHRPSSARAGSRRAAQRTGPHGARRIARAV